MKSGDSRPTALKALLRPFQMARRSSRVPRGAHFDGIAGADDLIQPHPVHGDGFARAFQFDDEDGLAAGRIIGVDSGYGRLQRQRIHDLDGARQQAAGDDSRDGVPGLLQRAIAGEHGVEALRPGQQLQRDLQRDAEEPFVAVEEAAPVGADVLAARAAPLDHFAGAEHGFDAEHVVGGHAVFQAMGAAGVEGDIAADGANQRAGRVRRVMQLVRRGGQRDLGIHHARLDHGNPLGGVQAQNPGQAVERDDDAVRHGQRAARQAGAAAARDKGQSLLVAEATRETTSSVVSGIATASGRVRKAVSPSLS